MANGVNVKMGVSGVAQFKQNMNQAKQSVKTLDAQLALTEKQFKASGDAEEYMSKKTAELQAKIEAQKSVVENAEKALQAMADNGVERSSAAYQKLYQEMLKAKGELLDTETALNGVQDAGDEAANGVSEMNAQLTRIGQGVDYQNVTDGLSKITDGLGSIITKAWETGEAIVRATLGAGSWADELKTTAEKYEISTDELQQWRKTANIIDTDVDTILTAKDKLAKNNSKQGKEYMGAMAFLGIDPRGKDTMDIFWEAGEAIANLGENADKNYYATQIFGKSWRELLPLFNAGKNEFDELNASWSIVEQDQLDGLGKMDDAYQKMQGEWETFKMELLSAFSGPLTEGMDTITGLFRELNAYLDTPEGQAMLKQIGDTISSLISDLTKIDPETVVAGFKSVVDGVTNALKWIDEHHSEVVAAMGAIVAGWAGLKVTGGVLEVLKVINGLKWIKNNPNITIPGTNGSGTGGGASGGSGGGWLHAAKFATAGLAFFGTLFKNALTEQGNDDLVGANGELTETAKKLGLSINENGELAQASGNKYDDMRIRMIQNFWDRYRAGEIDSQQAWNEATAGLGLNDEEFKGLMQDINAFIRETPNWRSVTDLPETIFQDGTEQVKEGGEKIEEAAKDMGKLPTETAAAVRSALTGVQVVIDGPTISAVIGSLLAEKVLNQ